MTKEEWYNYHEGMNSGDIYYFTRFIFEVLRSYDTFHNSVLFPDDFSTYFSIAVAK